MLSSTPVPAGVKDVSSIIKKVQGENPDAVCSFQYPPENALTYGTMAQLAYNPKCVLGGPATSTQAFYDRFKGALDGIMFEGAWSYKANDAQNAYYVKLSDFVKGKENVDFWGGLIYRAELEFFQAAVEKANTIDQAAIAEVMRTAARQDHHGRRHLHDQPDPRQSLLRRPDRPVAGGCPAGPRQGQADHRQDLVPETHLGRRAQGASGRFHHPVQLVSSGRSGSTRGSND